MCLLDLYPRWRALSLSLSPSLSLSLSHTHLFFSLSLTHTHLSLSLTHTHTHTQVAWVMCSLDLYPRWREARAREAADHGYAYIYI